MQDLFALSPDSQGWLEQPAEGELHVDVFRDGEQLVIRSSAAGVKAEDITLSVDGDLLTIRGERKDQQEIGDEDWFHRECYWGAFSRSLVLPLDVDADHAIASMKDGILEIRLPIRHSAKTIQIRTK